MHFVILAVDVYFTDQFSEYCSGLCNAKTEFPGWLSTKTCPYFPTAKVNIIINISSSSGSIKIIFTIILVRTNKL